MSNEGRLGGIWHYFHYFSLFRSERETTLVEVRRLRKSSVIDLNLMISVFKQAKTIQRSKAAMQNRKRRGESRNGDSYVK